MRKIAVLFVVLFCSTISIFAQSIIRGKITDSKDGSVIAGATVKVRGERISVVSASDGSFEISLEYMSCPEIENKVVIISDPMIATGASLVKSIQYLKEEGDIKEMHIVCAIACTVGIEYVKREVPKATIWCGDIDDEITAKGYIVPGLGDAGDLAFGAKLQS